ncbi:hypothetical protein [Nonomuraea cavernae]|uniref:hypothetical protein n=1 Tax=Nonomuraea cavernae TaxID=2045107 RepID=UPI00166ACD11|nr:hypothetical protein [Nonomuraea cavernae]MCA2183552.1 hypothetical protein [Nonomuraea cavernae]
MPQSEEHKFVTSTFIQAVEKLSKSELYGYTEADRGGFDFACILERDRSRPLVGQTLTHHSEGIEKDINWLLFADDAEIPVYLYSDTARNATRIRDTLHRARSSMANKVELMRLYSYPAGFDADSEGQREAIHDLIVEKIADDLLMNILFGRLTHSDISMFLNEIGIPGFLLACLEEFARSGMLKLFRPIGSPWGQTGNHTLTSSKPLGRGNASAARRCRLLPLNPASENLPQDMPCSFFGKSD